jgi:GntR family transcriptional regulator, transcriptional repressor for pyruvate dehydrogenase complex
MADEVSIPFQALERAPTLADRVTRRVMDLIAQAALKPGDRLPSERDLGDQFGVSRTVVREALRSLAAMGVLDVRSGSGVTVARVDVERASEALRLYVQGSQGNVGGVTYEQINDVREMIETRVARIAARSASDEDVAKLVSIHDEFCARSDDPEIASQLDVAFHRAIAESVHNPLFLVMLDSIEPVLLEIRRRVAGVPGRPDRAMQAHALILRRIREGDPEKAELAMTEHLEESRGIWRDLAIGSSAAARPSDR